MRRTTTSVSTNAATPTAVHTAWTRARSRSRREMVTKPMPLRSAAIGSSVGSARARTGGPRGARPRRGRAPRARNTQRSAGMSGLVGEQEEHVAAAGDRRRRGARGRARGCVADVVVTSCAGRRPPASRASARRRRGRGGGRGGRDGRGRRGRGGGRRGAALGPEPGDVRVGVGLATRTSCRPARRALRRPVGGRRAVDARAAARWSGPRPASPPGTPLYTVTLALVEADVVVVARVPADRADRDAEHEQDREHPARHTPGGAPAGPRRARRSARARPDDVGVPRGRRRSPARAPIPRARRAGLGASREPVAGNGRLASAAPAIGFQGRRVAAGSAPSDGERRGVDSAGTSPTAALDHVDDDDGDVVLAAGGVGGVDERVAARVGSPSRRRTAAIGPRLHHGR